MCLNSTFLNTGRELVRWLQVIGCWPESVYTNPAPVLLLTVLGRTEREPLRPMGRKGLDSEVMTMLGIRPMVPRIMCPSEKSPLCQQESRNITEKYFHFNSKEEIVSVLGFFSNENQFCVFYSYTNHKDQIKQSKIRTFHHHK